jgi:hypothetical protein
MDSAAGAELVVGGSDWLEEVRRTLPSIEDRKHSQDASGRGVIFIVVICGPHNAALGVRDALRKQHPNVKVGIATNTRNLRREVSDLRSDSKVFDVLIVTVGRLCALLHDVVVKQRLEKVLRFVVHDWLQVQASGARWFPEIVQQFPEIVQHLPLLAAALPQQAQASQQRVVAMSGAEQPHWISNTQHRGGKAVVVNPTMQEAECWDANAITIVAHLGI